jgi:hypothetical protein
MHHLGVAIQKAIARGRRQSVEVFQVVDRGHVHKLSMSVSVLDNEIVRYATNVSTRDATVDIFMQVVSAFRTLNPYGFRYCRKCKGLSAAKDQPECASRMGCGVSALLNIPCENIAIRIVQQLITLDGTALNFVDLLLEISGALDGSFVTFEIEEQGQLELHPFEPGLVSKRQFLRQGSRHLHATSLFQQR